MTFGPVLCEFLNGFFLTPNRPVVHTCLTYPKLNMGGFSALTGQLGQVHMAKKIFSIFLHAGRWFFFVVVAEFVIFLKIGKYN